MSAINSRPLSTEGPSAGGGDEFDDIFNYDADINDPFSENYVSAKERQIQKEAGEKAKGSAGLGIDEEVEVTRKPRAPRVKLDENRLLSANGIPKLRNRAKHHLKFKGKGHEYSDTAKLLSFYQIWLDDLFPKARFLDALAMVEKMGHKKRLQMMRMEWINEGKPQTVHEDSLFDEPALPPRENDGREKTASRIAPIFETAAGGRTKTPTLDSNSSGNLDLDNEDLYGATPRASRQRLVDTDSQDSLFGGTGASIFGPAKTLDNGPDDDELDALMAETEGAQGTATRSNKPVSEDTLEDDDLDALLAEEETLQTTASSKPAAASKPPIPQDDFDDEMEAMAGMGGMW